MKNLITAIVVAVLTLSQISFAQSIVGTKHDMSAKAWNTATTNKICGVCHTPHNAYVVSQAPLWSHAQSVAAYTMYTNAVSSTFNATPGAAPDGASKLCLSCHDGTVALDNFKPINGVTTTMGAISANVGTDLSNDHPISFTYDAALVAADGGLHPITDPFLTGTIATKALFAGKLQCASCHNPHDNSFTKFQRMDNTNSELCLKCHLK